MKTYFLSWQCDNKIGHATADASDDIKPQDALNQMLDAVREEFKDELKGNLFANQFNNVVKWAN